MFFLRRVGKELFDHGFQGNGSFASAGRPHEQEIVVSFLGLQEDVADGLVRVIAMEGGCPGKGWQPLP